MGKTTLYHPVPLNVVRGAAEYCGWKFKKIKQYESNQERGHASYKAEIEAMPKSLWGGSLDQMEKHLQECFLDDIRVYWFRRSKGKGYCCDLIVQLTTPQDKSPEPLTLEQWREMEEGRNE